MIPEFTTIDQKLILDKELTVHVKAIGSKVFWDGKVLTKKPKVPILTIDKLLSDIYTNAAGHFDDSVLYGYYIYNNDTDTLISGKSLEKPNFICLKSNRKRMDMQFLKTMKMNHVNSILSDIGMLNHKKIISSIIFKENAKPVFKYVIKKPSTPDVPSYLVKMLGYKFFNSRIKAINTFTSRHDALLSIANQIFIHKLNADLSISSKMVFDPNIKIKSIPDKLSLLGNTIVVNLINENNNLYYVYISLIHMLSNMKYDEFITDQSVKANITHYRELIDGKQTLLSFKEFNSCRELLQI